MKYYYKTSIYSRVRKWRRAHRLVFLVLILILLLIGVVSYMIWRNSKVPVLSQQSEEAKGFYESKSNTSIDTEYFSFRSDINWELTKAESTASQYVYTSKRSGQSEHRFIVYVNTIPEDTRVTYVLPVSQKIDNTFEVGKISPKCSVPQGTNQSPRPMDYNGIKYICIPDREQVLVAAGSVGNGYMVPLRNAKAHTIGFFYQNLTSQLTTVTMEEVFREFKVK